MMVPTGSTDVVNDLLRELWNRNGYGPAATAMIRQFPIFGIGIGCFHVMVSDFTDGGLLIADNAQNWYRHQLAELGMIGSLGWIAWVLAFGWFVVKRHPGEPRATSIVRGMLIGFALISLVGMPSQSPAVTFTFWTIAFWYVSMVGVPEAKPSGRTMWTVVIAIFVVFVVGSAYLAGGDLRLGERARRLGFPYSYGFSFPEPDGSGGEYRWAARRGSIVIDVPKPGLTIRVWVNHRDISTNPVNVRVWQNGEPLIETQLTSTDPVTQSVRLPENEKRVLIDTWVSRVVHPADFGVADARELGLMVQWTFSD
jgi:hypothetical protein